MKIFVETETEEKFKAKTKPKVQCFDDNNIETKLTTQMVNVSEISLWRTVAAKQYAISQKRSGDML